MDTPYCIVKGKARLGQVVHKKTATCLAITTDGVRQEDKAELATLCKTIKSQFNENEEKIRRTWGGGIMGVKNVARMRLIRAMLAKEAAKKAGL
jgi:large subunit ribosomal protein L7Ae